LQVILAGQPKLEQRLQGSALKQRIAVPVRLIPLTPGETAEFVRHRLRIAGSEDRQLFSSSALESLPVIAVTAHAILEEESAIWDSGVNDVVTKPIDEATLLDAIRRSLRSGA